MAVSVPGGMSGLGVDPYSALVGGIFESIGSISGNVPAISAAFGNKKAAALLAQQASIQCAQAGGTWTGSYCDTTAAQAAAAQAAQAQAGIDRIKAYAPFVALGVGAIGLTFAVTRAFQVPTPPQKKTVSRATSGRPT